MLKIEAVTICIGYADFLAETAKYNVGLFDRWLIVTSDSDEGTREVCRKYSLPTLLSEDHLRGGDFAKGRLIERGLQHLSSDGWRMHLDADVVLPGTLHRVLDSSHLQESHIYGCDRVMVRSWSDWQKLQQSGWLNHDYHCRVNPPAGFQIGTRWADRDGGYVPIGFMQLWNSAADQWRGARIRPYPINHNDACRTDVQHSLQWDRRQRALIPELLAVHLESQVAPMGANWNGRTTMPFGPNGASYLPRAEVAALMSSKAKSYTG